MNSYQGFGLPGIPIINEFNRPFMHGIPDVGELNKKENILEIPTLDADCKDFKTACEKSRERLLRELNQVILSKLIFIKKSIDNGSSDKFDEFTNLKKFIDKNDNLICNKIKLLITDISNLYKLLGIINELKKDLE